MTLTAHNLSNIWLILPSFKFPPFISLLLWRKGVSQFPRDPYGPYNLILSGVHEEIELRHYVRKCVKGSTHGPVNVNFWERNSIGCRFWHPCMWRNSRWKYKVESETMRIWLPWTTDKVQEIFFVEKCTALHLCSRFSQNHGKCSWQVHTLDLSYPAKRKLQLNSGRGMKETNE